MKAAPTRTYALLAGSPAIDQGEAFQTTTDQRAETRPFDLANVDNATGGDGSDIGAFELNNRPPAAVADSYTTNEDTPINVSCLGGVLANDTDPDTGDALEAVLVSGPSHADSFTMNADGSFSYAPKSNFNGEDYFTYKANDGKIDSEIATVSITVTAVNDAPGFTKGADQTVNEDAGAQSLTGWAKDISAGPSDESGQQVSFGVTNDNNALFTSAGQPAISSDGTLTYTPAKDANGTATVTVRATDNGSTANGGADTSAAQTFRITVKAVNDAPTVTVVAGSASQSACLSDTTGRLTLKLSDVDSNLSDLKPSVAGSSDTKLVPKSNVVFGGSGGTRTATISTVPGRTGTSTVTITISDGQASSSVPVTVKAGGNGNDTLLGTSGADLLLGQNGDDALGGAGASDVLCGVNGNDRLSGGTGPDTFDGGPGTDTATDYSTTGGDVRTNIP